MALMMNFPPPSEGIHHSEPNTRALWEGKDLGKGTLYISESVLCWVSGSDGSGFSLQYPSIFIHAVSTDTTNFPDPCLYLMVDGKIALEKNGEMNGGTAEGGDQLSEGIDAMNVDGEDEDGEEENERTNEVRFVPDNRNMLDVMFRALLDCQALNPDPNEPEDDDDGGVMVAPSFNIQVANGGEFEEEFEEEEDEDDEDDQFEDAES